MLRGRLPGVNLKKFIFATNVVVKISWIVCDWQIFFAELNICWLEQDIETAYSGAL